MAECSSLPSGRLVRRVLTAADGAALDEAMVVYFPSPGTYTGENVVELHVHGSPVLVDAILDRICKLGARPARPGEFTLRAFLNGRKDLAQAEAVRDIVEATSEAGLRAAAGQLLGSLAPALEAAAGPILTAAAALEAEIDFPEDVAPMPSELLRAHLDSAANGLRALAASHAKAAKLREGFRVVLTGAANAGKSSLFNALLGRDRALVTDEAGTTRDFIEEILPFPCGPVLLVDTAGFRAPGSAAEKAGIERSAQQIRAADMVLLLVDPTRPPNDEDIEVARATEGKPRLVVETKADLDMEGTSAEARLRPPVKQRPGQDCRGFGVAAAQAAMPAAEIRVSAVTGAGIDGLRARLAAAVEEGVGAREGGMITSLRQRDLVAAALGLVEQAAQQLDVLPRDVLASTLKQALARLHEVTGRGPVSEVVLDSIFSTFCLGK